MDRIEKRIPFAAVAAVIACSIQEAFAGTGGPSDELDLILIIVALLSLTAALLTGIPYVRRLIARKRLAETGMDASETAEPDDSLAHRSGDTA